MKPRIHAGIYRGNILWRLWFKFNQTGTIRHVDLATWEHAINYLRMLYERNFIER